jgi:hypothetical protein
MRLRDKVRLILSRNTIGSDRVEDEVTKAFAEERTCKQFVLFPIRLDDTVMRTTGAWAGKLRDNRDIGDFRKWGSRHRGGCTPAFEPLCQKLRWALVSSTASALLSRLTSQSAIFFGGF